MTPRITAGLTAAAAVMLAVLVVKVMAVSILAGTALACPLIGAIALLAYWLLATGKGAHVAPRGHADDELIALPHERTIPRAPTEHEPPWEPAPAFQAAPVIEPDAITHGPPLMAAPVWDDPPEAIIIGVGTMSGGRVTSAHVTIVPPVQCPALPQWVTDILGADSVDGAMAEISSVVHSWESNYTKGDARYMRALTDGAP